MVKRNTDTPNELSTKIGFWLPLSLQERMREHVDKHRNAPESMTINRFVREAIEASLSKTRKKAA